MFRLIVNTDNDAFEDDPSVELSRLMQEVAEELRNGVTRGNLLDINGNRVGSYELT